MTPRELIRGLENEKNRLNGKDGISKEDYKNMLNDCIEVLNAQDKYIELLQSALEIARCGYES